MNLTCESLKEFLKPLPLVRECDIVKSGAVRIATPFHYPDGSLIDVFLTPMQGLFENYYLSDCGQTNDYVANLNFDLAATKKRRALIDDICSTLDVKFSDGSFGVVLEQRELENLSPAIARLAQACIRASDLVYTQRFQVPGTFQDEVEEFLSAKKFEYEPDFPLIGDYGREVRIDFKVVGRSTASLLQTLSSRANGHALANERLSKWVELESYKQFYQLLTLVDQDSAGFQQTDLQKLGRYSTVINFPKEQEQLYEMLQV